jgi:hypothetical protein
MANTGVTGKCTCALKYLTNGYKVRLLFKEKIVMLSNLTAKEKAKALLIFGWEPLVPHKVMKL